MQKNKLLDLFKEKGIAVDRMEFIDEIEFDTHPLLIYHTTGLEAFNDWKKLRDLRLSTGLLPVIVKRWKHYNFKNDQNDIEKSIEKAIALDVEKILQEALELHLSFTDQKLEAFEDDWPEEEIPLTNLRTIFQENVEPHQRKEYFKDMDIILLPTQDPWSIFAFLDILPLEDFYFYHDEEEHIAIMKYFYEKFEAEIAALALGEIELFVGKPPKTREEAFNLAKQHFSYCYDALRNAGGSLQTLASTLIHAPIWYFGWLELILE